MKRSAGPQILAWAAACAVAAMVSPALAGTLHGERWKYERRDAAPKDCTRFNGRWGYYGNPWCTPAEQRAFDLWEARRLSRQRFSR